MSQSVAPPDFIEIYPQALDRAHCAGLVERFSASGDTRPGRVGGGVMPALKDSRDLTISGRPEWRDAEGETEFLYQQRKIAPRAGSLLIAPAAFTHTHRGNRPQGSDKFIATSWVLFQRAERLFGAAATG